MTLTIEYKNQSWKSWKNPYCTTQKKHKSKKNEQCTFFCFWELGYSVYYSYDLVFNRKTKNIMMKKKKIYESREVIVI